VLKKLAFEPSQALPKIVVVMCSAESIDEANRARCHCCRIRNSCVLLLFSYYVRISLEYT
jgi:hypothetical protein